MNTVTFPGLGLTLHLPRVAFSIGSFHIYWYGIIIAIGFVAGTIFCVRCMARRMGLRGDDLVDMMLFAAPGGIVGARLYYILFNSANFRRADGSLDLKACLNVHNGGLAIYGGVIAAVLIAFLVARYKKIPFPALLDACTCGLLIGQIIGRWGNFMNVEAYGAETDLPWRMGIEKGGQYLEVHPTFLYESLWNLIGLCLLLWFVHRGRQRFDGELFLRYVAWYGLGRGFIEGLRTDSLYLFSTGIRTSQLLAFVSCAAAVCFLVWKRHGHADPNERYCERTKEK